MKASRVLRSIAATWVASARSPAVRCPSADSSCPYPIQNASAAAKWVCAVVMARRSSVKARSLFAWASPVLPTRSDIVEGGRNAG